jgi:hypothetical protein
MTKKDYIKIADILKAIKSNGLMGGQTQDWANDMFADMLQTDNEAFNRTKFIEYINND